MAVLPVFNPTPRSLEINRGVKGVKLVTAPGGGSVIHVGAPGSTYRVKLSPENVRSIVKFLQNQDKPEHVPSVQAAGWDEHSQLVRVTVDGIPFNNNHNHSTAADCRLVAEARRRSAVAFDAMAEVLYGREESEREAGYQRDIKRKQVMEEAGHPFDYADAQESVRRLVDMLVDAQAKL